jgi:hypothetical protein
MTRTSRLLVASFLTITSITIAGMLSVSPRLVSAKATESTISNQSFRQIPPMFLRKGVRTFRPALHEVDSQHELAVPFYNLSGDWTSTLMLSNQAPRQMQVSPTLFTLSGQRLDIPPITLEAHQQRVFDLSHWALSPAFQKGSLQISYFGPERVVAGEVKVVRANHSLVFDEQLIEPEDYFKSSRLEGVWWLPSRESEMSIVVSNTNEAQLLANLTIYDSQGTNIGSRGISLGAHETRVIIAKELISNHERNLPEIGGISISHTGVPGSLFASMLIQEPATGFSSIVELQDPDAAVSSRLDGAGLRIGRVAGAELNQVAVARNVGRSNSVLSTRIVYTRRDGSDGVIPVRELRLKPGETSNLDLDKAVRRSGIDHALAAGLEFKYESPPGSIVISALSVTNDGIRYSEFRLLMQLVGLTPLTQGNIT